MVANKNCVLFLLGINVLQKNKFENFVSVLAAIKGLTFCIEKRREEDEKNTSMIEMISTIIFFLLNVNFALIKYHLKL